VIRCLVEGGEVDAAVKSAKDLLSNDGSPQVLNQIIDTFSQLRKIGELTSILLDLVTKNGSSLSPDVLSKVGRSILADVFFRSKLKFLS
jgi:K+-transporting ATPase c subunit